MIALLSALALLSTQDAPSFDCTAAMTPTENAICTDPELGRLDQRIADRYAVLRSAYGARARIALQRDQEYFLAARDSVHDAEREGLGIANGPLVDFMRARADMLDALEERPSQSPMGTWLNLEGGGFINAGVHRGLVYSLNTAQPINARWVCEAEGAGRQDGDLVTLEAGAGWRLAAQVRDGVLFVDEAGEGSPPYCGANGSLSGVYFRANRQPWNG